eukprot:111207-Rhodomonas_salina.1
MCIRDSLKTLQFATLKCSRALCVSGRVTFGASVASSKTGALLAEQVHAPAISLLYAALLAAAIPVPYGALLDRYLPSVCCSARGRYLPTVWCWASSRYLSPGTETTCMQTKNGGRPRSTPLLAQPFRPQPSHPQRLQRLPSQQRRREGGEGAGSWGMGKGRRRRATSYWSLKHVTRRYAHGVRWAILARGVGVRCAVLSAAMLLPGQRAGVPSPRR